MKKKLIKQLKGVGFEELNGKAASILKIKGGGEIYYWYNRDRIGMYFVSGTKGKEIDGLTFPQILAAIKEHTGVDLQPKKTKRQEIEELKKQAKENETRLNELTGCQSFNEKTASRVVELEKLVESQNEAIKKIETRSNELAQQVKANKKAIHEDTRFSIDSLKDATHELFKNQAARIEELEGKAARTTVQVVKEATLAISKAFTGKEPEADNFFKVGDKVLISEDAKGLYGFQIEAMETRIPLNVVRKVMSTPVGYVCECNDNHVGTFPAKWLKHAPKEAGKKPFEVGDRVVIVCDVNDEMDTQLIDAIKERKVLNISHYDKVRKIWGIHIEGEDYIFKSNDLEHAPKKELKLFGKAIVQTGTRDFPINTEVMLACYHIIKIKDIEHKKWRCYSDSNSGNYEYYYEEDLKAL